MGSEPGGWTRGEHFARLNSGERFDVLIIGGGVTGCGTALDLATRGLSVALVEQHDFACGTSGRSTKLFHGGIRYLPQFRFQLVAEGLREQEVLARIADYLFQPLEFIVPVYEQFGLADAPDWAARGRRASVALRLGLILYDLLGGLNRPGSRHRRLSLDAMKQAMPLLRTDGLRSGFAYSDAQTDDARLVIALARTAVEDYGAVAVNRVAATGLRSVRDGFIVRLEDRLTLDQFQLEARAVVAATGAFRAPAINDSVPLDLVRSKGTHLVVHKDAVGLAEHALVLPRTDDGRIMYIIPWAGHALIGTTDTPYDGDPAHPAASAEDVEYLGRHVGRYLAVDAVEPLSTFAGLRALASNGSGQTSQASREHMIAELRPGYVQVAGGKLTTYRRISAQAASVVAKRLRVPGKSRSGEVMLTGSGSKGNTFDDAIRRRYGASAAQVADLAANDALLGMRLGDASTFLAEVVHAVRRECAVAISDFTLRRTHLAWLTPDHSRKDQRTIAEVMARELGWTQTEIEHQIEAHEQELLAEGL
jgi:glycerol-3-phosphate dehydrogenase